MPVSGVIEYSVMGNNVSVSYESNGDDPKNIHFLGNHTFDDLNSKCKVVLDVPGYDTAKVVLVDTSTSSFIETELTVGELNIGEDINSSEFILYASYDGLESGKNYWQSGYGIIGIQNESGDMICLIDFASGFSALSSPGDFKTSHYWNFSVSDDGKKFVAACDKETHLGCKMEPLTLSVSSNARSVIGEIPEIIVGTYDERAKWEEAGLEFPEDIRLVQAGVDVLYNRPSSAGNYEAVVGYKEDIKENYTSDAVRIPITVNAKADYMSLNVIDPAGNPHVINIKKGSTIGTLKVRINGLLGIPVNQMVIKTSTNAPLLDESAVLESDGIYDGSTVKAVETEHLALRTVHGERPLCIRCNQRFGDEIPHELGALVPATAATHMKMGNVAYRECTTCHMYFDTDGNEITYYGDLFIPKIKEHSFSEKVESAKYCKTAATCTTPGVYYYSCVCGLIGEKTFEGKALGHTGGTATTTKKAVCTRCGKEYGELLKAEEPTKTPQKEVPKKEMTKNELSLNKGLKVSQSGKKVTVKWGKVSGADGYIVYANYCGKKDMLQLKDTKSGKKTSYSFTKLGGKALKLTQNFKVNVVAYKNVNGEQVIMGRTLVAHIIGSKNKTYSNPKSIKLSKTKVTLKVKKSYKIKAKTVLVNPKKKSLTNAHAKEFRYTSTNPKVATVSKTGKITAKKKGTCTVYVYARNGYAKAIKVTVK